MTSVWSHADIFMEAYLSYFEACSNLWNFFPRLILFQKKNIMPHMPRNDMFSRYNIA